MLAGLVVSASAEQGLSNASPREVLLLDNLGHAVRISTNAVPRALLPPERVGLENQIPSPVEGANTPMEIEDRKRAAQQGLEALQFFPDIQPRLMPYLSSVDDSGNTALRPGPLIPSTPFDRYPQQAKYWL